MAKSNKELAAENAELRQLLKAAKVQNKNIAIPVAGSYMAEWTNDLTGDKMRRKVEFKPGAAGVRLRGHPEVFPTEAVIALANGKKPKEEFYVKCPALKNIEQEKAAAELTHLAVIGYGLLKDHPAEKVEEEPAAPSADSK